MTDIVERLYDTSKFETWEDLTGLIVEAAVEIERLRKLLAATERDLGRALLALEHHLKADR